MGCDGGSIPKRKEIVKDKQQNQNRDRNADLSAKWQFCALSGLKLRKPIVSCTLGRLYNKDAVIEHLLKLKSARDQNEPSSSTQRAVAGSFHAPIDVSHIRSLKDVRTLILKEKIISDQDRQASRSDQPFKAQFTCPISGLDLNGKYKFYFPLPCGCVFSERALKEVSCDNKCILCSKQYDPETDLIVLNGNEVEVKELSVRMLKRKHQHKLRKNGPSTSIESNHEDIRRRSVQSKEYKRLKTDVKVESSYP